MGESPAVRAGWPKLAIGFAKRLPPPSPEAIFERIGPLRARVREASFRDFLDLRDFLALADATVEVLGFVSARSFWQEVMAAALRQPAIGELVRRAGVGNVEALPLLQRTADAFNFVHQQCGEWVVTGDSQRRSAVITLEWAPALIVESRAMLAVYSGNLCAAVVSLGLTPRVVASSEAPQQRLRFKVHW